MRAPIALLLSLILSATFALAQLNGIDSPRNFHTNSLPPKQIKLCDRGLAAAANHMRLFEWTDAEEALLKLSVNKPRCTSHLGFAVSLKLLALALDWSSSSLSRIDDLDRRLAPIAGQWVTSVAHKPTQRSSAFVYSCDAGCGGFADRMKGIQSVFLLAFLNDGMASFLHAHPFDVNDVLQLATPALPPPEWKWDDQKWIRIALQDFSLALRRRALQGAASSVNLQTVEGQSSFARDVLLAPMSVWLPPGHSFEWTAFNVDMYPLLRTSPLHAARVAAVYGQHIAPSSSFMHAFLSQETTCVKQHVSILQLCDSLRSYSHHLLEIMMTLKQRMCNGNIGVHVRTGKGGWKDSDFAANSTYFLEV
jgi:hypothetical protein